MSKTVKFNHEILNAEHGWNVSGNPLDTMFINDLGEMLTGEWGECHERCSDHSEYYQDATKYSTIEYVEPIVFEPETNTMIIPNRLLNSDEKDAMLEIAEAIDGNLLGCYFEGDNEYVGAMQALVDAGASAEASVMSFIDGDIVFLDEDEYDELDDYEKEGVFWTNDGEPFTVDGVAVIRY